jgi:iron complex outermembrane receptor protein
MTTWTRKALLSGGVAAGVLVFATSSWAQQRVFNIPSQPATQAVPEFARQAGVQIMSPGADLRGIRMQAVKGEHDTRVALAMMLAGTDLMIDSDTGDVIVLKRVDADPQGGSADDEAAVEALIVTAQKREEDIQDVPIAISAFTQDALEEQKIEGGFDLLKAIPNVTFSKNNFTSYNFAIRGIGTKAVSATTDPGVAVAFNNTALLQNRLFEQEYFDVERVEVLRGPQGTLYGRNATAGVINVISALPDMDEYEGSLKGEAGNYEAKRAQGMVNIPLVKDKLAVRVAGALTQREGYDFNSLTNNPVNGRDLWSVRVTVGITPTDRIRANLIWERFEEDDNRSRTGKQLCHRDNGLTDLDGVPLYRTGQADDAFEAVMRPAMFSQGCLPGNLYDDAAFGTPNGLALPFVFGMIGLGAGCVNCNTTLFPLGFDPIAGHDVTLLGLTDPYANKTQSHDLRVIESIMDPKYRAKADIFELNIDVDLTDTLSFTSQTAYNEDATYSFQDFNRFNTQPIFTDTSGLLSNGLPSPYRNLAPGGIFCDPQLGCSDRLVGFDIAQGKGRQLSQEFRLQSDFEGPVNFSAGANYTWFSTLIDYYVFYNLITAYALMGPFNFAQAPGVDMSVCGSGNDFFANPTPPVPTDDSQSICPYIDPNPIDDINGEGHNYFRSKNPYKLKSMAAFGEIYWNINEVLKMTAGLRYTDDRKTFTPVPSQILLARGFVAGGNVNRGYPEKPPIEQHWGEWTGRFGLDWKPALSFTEQTMLYAFYSRGYKGGGANPPVPGFATIEEYEQQVQDYDLPPELVAELEQFGIFPVLQLTAAEYGPTFEPEFVDAFEVGSKNTLLGGALQFNAGAFYYDYKDYQVSQIRDRSAVNENFDATIWGVEFETVFSPSRNLQIIGNLGYLDTKIADGETSIDIMDRTAGNPDWVVAKPWLQLPSNCVIPMSVAQYYVTNNDLLRNYWYNCGGVGGLIGSLGSGPIDPETGETYDPNYYDGTDGRPDVNGGAGFAKPLGGNELPNSPHWTVNIGAQYGVDWINGWRATVRTDAYWQSQSWARVYNSDPYDKLHGWYNVNLSVWLENKDVGLKLEFYAKNLLDKTPITDAFLNADDLALTTNVFVLDPRLIGVSLRKEF